MKEKKQNPKILFYTSVPRVFRSTLIGYLYEIAKEYPTILLSEKLDPETEKIINNKKIFPKLEDIIPVRQHLCGEMNIFARNKYFQKLAKDVIQKNSPDIVIASNDLYPFEMYLMRYAKKASALRIIIQASNTGDSATWSKREELTNIFLRYPSFLPFWFKSSFVKLKKYFSYYLYHWILPVTRGEMPFSGKASYMLKKGTSGVRDADYQIVFSKRDYEIYLNDGVENNKLYILPHPLIRQKTRRFLMQEYFKKYQNKKRKNKIATLMLPEETLIGFRKENYSLISHEERNQEWKEIIKLIIENLPDWKIYIKPHPSTKNISQIKKEFESISKNINVVDPEEPADKYIELGSIVIGMPLAISTTLFTASLQHPEKPIISLDFKNELWGDFYEKFEGIEHINNREKFVKILKLIKDNKCCKERKKSFALRKKEFPNTLEMINNLYNLKVDNR